MELNSDPVTAPPRAAATVVMLRDSDAGMQVFLLKRHGLSDVLGGAYVFPGGKVDPLDSALDMDAHLDQAPGDLPAGLNETGIDALAAASLYVAAIREALEESGVLFAHGANQQLVTAAGALLRAGHGFNDMLGRMSLRLQTRSMLPWVRWITPRVPSFMNKRFDTRFFIAAVPADQNARHDDHEATESVWLTPRAALQRYWQREIELAPPQIMSLAHLSHYHRVQDVLSAAHGRLPPTVMPEPFQLDGARVVCYPGDERHPVRERALPGPSRLIYRNKRFEPLEGFEALFTSSPSSSLLA